MQVMTLIEKQAIDQDMIQADINSLSPRPPSAACSPSNGGLKNIWNVEKVKLWLFEGHGDQPKVSKKPNEGKTWKMTKRMSERSFEFQKHALENLQSPQMLAIDNCCNIRHHCHCQIQLERHQLDELQYQNEHLNEVDWTWMNLGPRLLALST